jgi:hypothetical protein
MIQFELFENKTSGLIRLSYWMNVCCGLNKTRTIDVKPNEVIKIPTDDCVGEFIVEFENYSRCSKFRTERAFDGEWMWDYDDRTESSFDQDSKKITITEH